MEKFTWIVSTFLSLVGNRRHNNEDTPLRVIVVGIPRSGTSFVAGLVARMGFSLGPADRLKPADEHNRFGYYECVPIMRINDRIIEKRLGGNFGDNIPVLEDGWTKRIRSERRKIEEIVRRGNIEVLKDNRLLLLADLYDEVFPDVRWVMVQRDLEQTYRSIWVDITYSEWQAITQTRLERWYQSAPSQHAFYLYYSDFKNDSEDTVERLADFLGLELTPRQKLDCMAFFRPRKE